MRALTMAEIGNKGSDYTVKTQVMGLFSTFKLKNGTF